jgi:hypothetical protein
MSSLGAVFWATFVISLVASIVFLIVSYSLTRKFYSLLYVLSVFTYVNFVAFTIDAFDLSKNWIILLLAVSSLLLIGLGIFFSRIRRDSGDVQAIQKR